METGLSSGRLTSLPGRYAKSLFDLTQERREKEEVGRGLKTLDKLVRTSEELRQALGNPVLSNPDLVAALSEICQRLKVPVLLTTFLGELIKARRLSCLSDIEKIYQQLVSQDREETRVEVLSAHPLTLVQRNMLKAKLKEVLPGRLMIAFTKDTDGLGGVKIRIGSQMTDASLVSQLNTLATVMKGRSLWI